MALSEEVLTTIAYAEAHGYDKLNLLPPQQTRDMMKQAPANYDPLRDEGKAYADNILLIYFKRLTPRSPMVNSWGKR